MSRTVENYVDSMLEDDNSFDQDFDNNSYDNGEQLDNQSQDHGQDHQQQTQQQDHQQQQQQETGYEDNFFDKQLREEIEQNRQQMDGKKPSQKQGQEQEQQKGGQRNTIRPLGDGSFVNQRGDIVDEKGTVIAQRGFARRMYETNQRNNVRLQEQDRIIHQLRTQQAETNAIQTAAQNYGLGADELAQAVDFAGRVKRGGLVDVAKEIVALAVAQGHNVTDILGNEVGDSVDMRALRHMIGEVTTPLQQQQQQQQRQAQIQETAQARYNDFISRHEFASVHESDIARLAVAKNIDPTQAYYALREFCLKHNLDFSLPIEPQIHARAQQQTQQQQQRAPNNNQQRRRRPLPNGGNPANMQTAVPEASHDASWAEIIKSSLAGQ